MKVTAIATSLAGFAAAAPTFTSSHKKTNLESFASKLNKSPSSNLHPAPVTNLMLNLEYLDQFVEKNDFRTPKIKPLSYREDAASLTDESDKILKSRDSTRKIPSPPVWDDSRDPSHKLPLHPPFWSDSPDFDNQRVNRHVIKNMTLFEELTHNITEFRIFLQTTDPTTLREIAAEVFPEEYMGTLNDMSNQDIRDIVAELDDQQIADFIAGIKNVEARDTFAAAYSKHRFPIPYIHNHTKHTGKPKFKDGARNHTKDAGK